MKKLLLSLVFSLVAVTTAAAQSVTGEWDASMNTPGGARVFRMILKQDGEKLSGHYSSQTLGEADFTGSVKGMAITFSFNADAGGVTLAVTYTGTIGGKDAMKGTVSLGEAGDGTWTAKRL